MRGCYITQLRNEYLHFQNCGKYCIGKSRNCRTHLPAGGDHPDGQRRSD